MTELSGRDISFSCHEPKKTILHQPTKIHLLRTKVTTTALNAVTITHSSKQDIIKKTMHKIADRHFYWKLPCISINIARFISLSYIFPVER